MSLYEKLTAYAKEDMYPMHMPGHKRNQMFCMDNPYTLDITEIDDFDNLMEPEELLLHEMEKTASVFHAMQSLFLVNGSTSGILTGIFAGTNRGDQVLVARNCHVSVYHAILLRGLRPVYVYPKADASGILLGIAPAQVEEQLNKYPNISMVILTSPTYEGVVSDIFAIATLTHEKNIPLLVDEAHGAHFGFSPEFPKSANTLGADLVIQSVHKTLPAFTQTALLHRNSERVPKHQLMKYYRMFQTSSPSYVLLAGIDRCTSFVSEHREQFSWLAAQLQELYQRSLTFEWITLWKPKQQAECFAKDASKLVITTKDFLISGRELYQWLRENYQIQPEMTGTNYVLCMTSIGDTSEGFVRLMDALTKIDQELCTKQWKYKEKGSGIQTRKLQNGSIRTPNTQDKYTDIIRTKQVRTPAEAEECDMTPCPLTKSVGRVSGEFVYQYPPGIPILVPGEVISEEVLEKLTTCLAEGGILKGMRDQSKTCIMVLQNIEGVL